MAAASALRIGPKGACARPCVCRGKPRPRNLARMKFGPVPLADAPGAILAHSIRAGGQMLKKGRLLSADDLLALERAGVREVVVARIEDDDIREDEAAARIARELAGESVRIGAP